jgi:hypothetical protein
LTDVILNICAMAYRYDAHRLVDDGSQVAEFGDVVVLQCAGLGPGWAGQEALLLQLSKHFGVHVRVCHNVEQRPGRAEPAQSGP